MPGLFESCMMGCTACKPRYLRLVDAIYPRQLNEGLVNANMTKLTFYTITHPEKLNRIGVYLLDRLSRDLYRQRYDQVKVAVDAMNGLLQACHTSPSLSLFLENYLRMVQKLLETNDPDLEKMATDLFVRFSAIEEKSPTYHREYDFFISKFSAMCHANRGSRCKEHRYNGLRGIRGVIWKSVSDDMQADMWQKQHMTKIVPSILYNFQEEADNWDEHLDHSNFDYPYPDEVAKDEPHWLALQCLRELCGKCSFEALGKVLDPVLKHCDLHDKWNPPATFATHTFKAILYSIQTQHSFFVLQELIKHLESTKKAEVKKRIGVATVLANIVTISGATIGPLLLSIFSDLLKSLKTSVEYWRTAECMDPHSECMLQDRLIDVMGKFAATLPDYQKVEIMMFTVNYIATTQNSETLKEGDAYLQKVLLKTLLQIATRYKTFYLNTVFTESFLNTICKLSTSNDPELRLIAQQILQTLFDRHDNLNKLDHFLYFKDVEDLSLTIEKCTRQDQNFMKSNSAIILSSLYTFAQMMDEDDLQKHADSLLCSMCLICIETGHDAQLIELFRLCFALQDLALDSTANFNIKKRATLHNVVAKYMNLCSQLLCLPALCHDVQQVIENRREHGHALLDIMSRAHPIKDPLNSQNMSPGKAPIAQMESVDEYTGRPLLTENDKTLLFDLEAVAKILKSSNKSVDALFKPFTSTLSRSDGKETVNVSARRPHLTQRRSIPFDQKDSVDKQPDRSIGADDEDERSLSVSSFDWSLPSDESMNDAISWTERVYKPDEVVTLEELQQFSNSDPDPTEEAKQDQEKSQEILSRFRGKTAEEYVALLKRPRRDADGESKALVKRLLDEHQQWLTTHDYARHNLIASIDELKLPKHFIC
ncbi:hypothetical protein M3Y98_00973300 [Aphelenchoides besseyi]|nr:hypothetical protein M3Y98_00973300 [Aphelenchoides besseyi]KAI6194968.1 hypothetical protein M3Y96_01181200 [Aphelenchoides besseyi]